MHRVFRHFILSFALLFSGFGVAADPVCLYLLQETVNLGALPRMSLVASGDFLHQVQGAVSQGVRIDSERFMGYRNEFLKKLGIAEGTPYWDFRSRYDTRLRSVFREIGLIEESSYRRVRTDQEARALLEKIGEALNRRVGSYRRDQTVIPAVFVQDPTDANRRDVFLAWHFAGSGPEKPDAVVAGLPDLHFENWGRLLSVHGVLPVSAGKFTFHDLSHVLAMLRNPYEEMVLQRRFYDFLAGLKARFPKGTDAEESAYPRFKKIANYFFEGSNFPNLEATSDFFGKLAWNESDYWMDGKVGILSYEKLARAGQLPASILDRVKRFETEFLSTPERFYVSFDGYGGGYYDFNSHFSFSALATTDVNARSGYRVDLEALYMQHFVEPNEPGPKLRLFVAYFNAHRLKMSFEKAVQDATANAREVDSSGLPVPWKGTETELYFRSYSDPLFLQNMM